MLAEEAVPVEDIVVSVAEERIGRERGNLGPTKTLRNAAETELAVAEAMSGAR